MKTKCAKIHYKFYGKRRSRIDEFQIHVYYTIGVQPKQSLHTIVAAVGKGKSIVLSILKNHKFQTFKIQMEMIQIEDCSFEKPLNI